MAVTRERREGRRGSVRLAGLDELGSAQYAARPSVSRPTGQQGREKMLGLRAETEER
jgi:hypothetical protein